MSMKDLSPAQVVVALIVVALHGAMLLALLPRPAHGETTPVPRTPTTGRAEVRTPTHDALRRPPSADLGHARATSSPFADRRDAREPSSGFAGTATPTNIYASAALSRSIAAPRAPLDDIASFRNDRDPQVREAFAQGAAFSALREKTERKRRFSKLATQYASIAALPMPDMWTSLEPLAKQGDVVAIAEMTQIARDCDEARRFDDPNGHSSPLPSSWKEPSTSPATPKVRNRTELAFLAGAADHTARTLHAFALMCRNAGIGLDRLFALTNDRGVPIADAEQAALTATRERQNPGLAETAALEALRALQRRMALRDSLLANHDTVDQHVARGDAPGAYAYARYGEWLAAQACYEPLASEHLPDARRNASHVATKLTPTARAEAERRAAVLIESFGNEARSTLECDSLASALATAK
jgi:hypothetical protein